ncbi:MAG TPA: hypothetical protein PK170_08510 [Anaerolineae bacterium]|nr:hypothetical protein [Anaerolineae bacterium]
MSIFSEDRLGQETGLSGVNGQARSETGLSGVGGQARSETGLSGVGGQARSGDRPEQCGWAGSVRRPA